MKVAFRADAGLAMGSGHIMRALCLAGALRERGAHATFFCRELPSHLERAIAAEGHSLRVLAMPAADDAPQDCWPAARQAADAQATREVLGDAGTSWLVADHYGLGREWEAAMRPAARRVMAIDDLGRMHDCDLLLDANLHARPLKRYEGRVPATAQCLLGPSFALLRPEFAAARQEMRTRGGAVRRILVFMGGMDAGNATGTALEAIALSVPRGTALDVVIGTSHPARAAAEAFCAGWSGATCHVQTDRMAALLAACDLAIGAGGGATWERCCLGVPTLALALADNQRTLLGPAAAAGLVYTPDGPVPDAARLAIHLRALLDNEALREALSAAGLEAVDGRGARRVAAAMAAALVRVRPAVEGDGAAVLSWRNASRVRGMSLDSGEISAASHVRWFSQVLAAPDRALLVGEDDLGPVGVVRFDLGESEATVSIYLAHERHGQGLGPGLLRAAEEWLAASHPGILEVHAQVLGGNSASLRLFKQGGYRQGSHRFTRRIRA